MSSNRFHQVKTEENSLLYKFVRKRLYGNGKVSYIARLEWMERGRRRANSKEYPTEREAAIAVDRFRIDKGMEPINILKRTE